MALNPNVSNSGINDVSHRGFAERAPEQNPQSAAASGPLADLFQDSSAAMQSRHDEQQHVQESSAAMQSRHDGQQIETRQYPISV